MPMQPAPCWWFSTAIDLLGEGVGRVPLFHEVVRGTDCDAQWSWHVRHDSAEWADLTIEVCDGCPWFVEEELDYWVESMESYCPWDARVEAVDDRR
jgi:hypothetical protein